MESGTADINDEQQLMDVVMEMEMEEDTELVANGEGSNSLKNPVIRENGFGTDIHQAIPSRHFGQNVNENVGMSSSGTSFGHQEGYGHGQLTGNSLIDEMLPAPNGNELSFQGDHDGYKYYVNISTGTCYSKDGSGYWYVQTEDGHFRSCHAAVPEPVEAISAPADHPEGYVPLDESGRPIYPLNSEGKPILPVFPMGSDEKPLFPWDSATGRPTFPVDDAGQPVFPIGADGRPIVPVDLQGVAVFPKGPDGSFIFPSQDGKPVAPVTIHGISVVPLDENGKAIVPYDADGNAMIHVGPDGITPLTEAEYQQQLQWHQYYEQCNQYAAQFYGAPPPMQPVVQPTETIGYACNTSYEGWQGIKATKKVRPEDIDLPILPQSEGMIMPPPGVMQPPMPSLNVGSNVEPAPVVTEEQRLQDAKKKKLLEMQLKFSKKIELARAENAEFFTGGGSALATGAGQVQNTVITKSTTLNNYLDSLTSSTAAKALSRAEQMLQRFDPRLFDDERAHSPPRRQRRFSPSRSPRRRRRSRTPLDGQRNRRRSRSGDRSRENRRSSPRRRSPDRSRSGRDRGDRDRSKQDDRNQRRRRSDDEKKPVKKTSESDKAKPSDRKSKREISPALVASEILPEMQSIVDAAQSITIGPVPLEMKKPLVATLISEDEDEGERKKKKKRKKSKSRHSIDGESKTEKDREVTDLLDLIERTEGKEKGNEDREEGEILDEVAHSPAIIGPQISIGPQWEPEPSLAKKGKLEAPSIVKAPPKKKQFHVAFMVETVTEPIIQYTSNPEMADSFIAIKHQFDAADGWKRAQKAFRHVEQALAILGESVRSPSPEEAIEWRQRHMSTEEGDEKRQADVVFDAERWKPMDDNGSRRVEEDDQLSTGREKSKRHKKSKKHKKEKRHGKSRRDNGEASMRRDEEEERRRLEDAERRRIDEEKEIARKEEETRSKREEDEKREKARRDAEEWKRQEEMKKDEERLHRQKKEEETRRRKEETERRRQEEEKEEKRRRQGELEAERRREEEVEMRLRVIAEQKRRLEEEKLKELAEQRKREQEEAELREKLEREQKDEQRREVEAKKRKEVDEKTKKKRSSHGDDLDSTEKTRRTSGVDVVLERRIREMEQRLATKKSAIAPDDGHPPPIAADDGESSIKRARLDDSADSSNKEEELKLLRIEAMNSRAERLLFDLDRKQRQLKREQRKIKRMKKRRHESTDSNSSQSTTDDDEEEDEEEGEVTEESATSVKRNNHRGDKHKKKKRKRSKGRKKRHQRSESSESDDEDDDAEPRATIATNQREKRTRKNVEPTQSMIEKEKTRKTTEGPPVLQEKIGGGNTNAQRLLDQLRSELGGKKSSGSAEKIHSNLPAGGSRRDD